MIEYEYIDEYKDVLTLRSMTTKRGRPAVLVSCDTTEDVSASVIIASDELPCLIEALQSLYDYDNPPTDKARAALAEEKK